jgi:hypothetical protein
MALINRPGRFNAKDEVMETVNRAQKARSLFVHDHVSGSRWDLLAIGNLRTRPVEETKKTLPAVGSDSRLVFTEDDIM